MTRPSPGSERVVALVDILTARPDEALTLAEITRRLGVNKSTCHSMLRALTEAGWLLRDPYQKTYRLGPTLVSVGRAAASGFPALEFVRPAMIELSRYARSHCVALAVAPEHVTVVDQVRDVRAQGAPIGHGFIPLHPPFGAAVAAWSGPEGERRWLDLAPPASAERYAKALDAIRSRGYVIELAEPPLAAPSDGAPLPQVVQRLARALTPDVLPLEVEDDRTYAVSAINAAVMGADGAVVLVVSLMGFPDALCGSEVADIGRRLHHSAATVSAALGSPDPGTGRRARPG